MHSDWRCCFVYLLSTPQLLTSAPCTGDWTPLPKLRLGRLLPVTDHYVTYQGSLTYPGCHETVTWLIYNRPVYISQAQVWYLSKNSLINLTSRLNLLLLLGIWGPSWPSEDLLCGLFDSPWSSRLSHIFFFRLSGLCLLVCGIHTR